MPKFIPGLKLSEDFYKEIVKPLLEKEFVGLKYSAGLIDFGSEVLGFDTEISRDHHWGPRVLLFLSKKDFEKKKSISNFLSNNLPNKFKGYSTNFGSPDDIGVQFLKEVEIGNKINHRVEIYTIDSFFKEYLSLDLNKEISVFDWLTFPEQKLRTIKNGKIFHDDLDLNLIRKKLFYYPKDIWLFLLASEWMKISQEEAFVGRTGHVGDELGSKVISARLVHSLMNLCFLMEKEYSAYSKWFGTAFSKLKSAKKLTPTFNKVLLAETWKDREKYLSKAYSVLANMHNELKITKELSIDVSSYHERPYFVIHADIFANEIKKKIKDPLIKKIRYEVGSVNQITNTADLLENSDFLKKLKILYK
ncbi:MAG: DUF4037 domain-containing protein [Candidatus Magasanikbacteria bacterium]